VNIHTVRTDWLRIPLSQPIADSTHTLRFIDLILIEVGAGDHFGTSYMLSFDYAPGILKGIIDEELKRHVLGQPAEAIRNIYERNLAATEYVGQEGIAIWGTAAIDVALWDLLARRLGVPAALLFGLNSRAVPVYGSGGWLSYTDEQLADEIARYIARGFSGVKLKIGGDEDRDVERVHAVRRVIGPKCKLMVDANQALSLEKALRLARRLEDCNLEWFEEPFPRHDVESYEQLSKRTQIPLAAGEREFGTQGFRRLVGARAISVVQPDLLRVGGVTAWRLVAALADINLLRLAPHFYREYDLHLAAAQPSTVAIESFDWLDPLLEHPFVVRDGCAHISDQPGFAVTFKPEAIREYRHRSKS
jgi:L-alanine-DL-glutamate epimerase-like enolase superfamily enzyme